MSESPNLEVRAPFSRKTVILLIATATLSLASAFAAALFGAEYETPPTSDSSAYSRSALGHYLAAKVLDEPVSISRFDSPRKAGTGLLVLAEPGIDDESVGRTLELIGDANATLVVLPKWDGTADSDRPGWVSSAEMLDPTSIAPLLGALAPGAELVRREKSTSPSFTLGTPLQAVRSSSIEAVIADGDDIVLGKLPGGDVWLLAEPDLINNHGIVRGENASLWQEIVGDLRSEGGSVVFDETIHGFELEPSIWQELFRFPLSLATLQLGLLGLVVLWATVGRFGAPLRRKPALAPGTATLVANTATLLESGGHGAEMLAHYCAQTIASVERRLQAPRSLASNDRATWLGRIEKSRRTSESIVALEETVAKTAGSRRPHPRRIVDLARRIHRWRQEILHESR